MGSFANTLFTIMLGWAQSAVMAVWSALTTENGDSFLRWIGRNWIALALILCAVGITVDLGVYLVRWRPIKVWKSFFMRLKRRKGEPEAAKDEAEVLQQAVPAPVATRSGRLFSYEADAPEDQNRQMVHPESEMEDFSRWIPEEPEPAAVEKTEKDKPLITGAGYSVPADSPYRRPVEPEKKQQPAEPVTDTAPEEKPEIMARRKRRRSLIMGELFSNPEEDLYQYDLPQQLIDKDKAYHRPVYPSGWTKEEGEDP